MKFNLLSALTVSSLFGDVTGTNIRSKRALQETTVGTVVDVATGEGVFGTLLTAATAAGLVETLNNPDATLTVFAPVDTAFEGVDVDALLADTEALKTLLLNHVLLSEVLSTDLSDGQVVTMAGGSDVTVMIGDGKVMINNAEVVDVDVMASNGVIHAVDSVITFEEKEEPDSSVKAFSLAPIVFTAMISMIVV
uniref:FAS1 domain-containing protein n=1 Tax=Proboscia inermis TaxID=420281 RepID=A0A7S0GFT9_9STRA|mmetsp:Transcript_3586/g.3656  ORF Transcript_3586/g.3656 Transcript_3586/m.3656 type:complete len:194 (+) Transcript_3586:64-645(+)